MTHLDKSLALPGPFANEPPLDFARRDVRDAFQQALAAVQATFPVNAPAVIGGRRVETKAAIDVPSPNDASLLVGRSASASADDARRAVDAAAKAFPAWSATRPESRARLLLDVAAAIRKRRVELAALLVHEAAKPWREADADIIEGIDFLEFYAREMLRLAQPLRLQPSLLGERNDLTYHPLGVVAVIGPWNFPMAIPVGMMSAALVAGNTVIWKPAEQTPLITWRIFEILEECGLPPGVVNFLPGHGEQAGQALLESPAVHMVVFTGSREVGLHIVRECAVVREGQGFVKRAVTEMGGKNALIIDSTADLDSAVPDILHSAFGFAGQKCSALSRLIVLGDVHDELLPRLREGVASLKIAPSTDPGCQVPPVIDEDARKKVLRYLDIGASEGRLLARVDPSEDLARRGTFVPVAVFEGINPSHRLAREEVFGPVLAVLRARDWEDALRIANDTEYALTGGVHSRTMAHLDDARRRLRCGNLYLNRGITGAIVDRQPFGGFAMSGVGAKTGGPDYLKQFLVARACSENLMRHGFAPLN